MSILSLHGFLETAGNENRRALRYVFPNVPVISPYIDYTKEYPEAILRRLKKIIHDKKVTVIVGQCLGAYYAVRLAQTYGIPCVITNPCLFPLETQFIVDSKIDRSILNE